MRYDVTLRMTNTYTFAVEADSTSDAHAKALEELDGEDPETMEITAEVLKGVA